MKKIFLSLCLVVMMFSFIGVTFAQAGTVLPSTEINKTVDDCNKYLEKVIMKSDFEANTIGDQINEVLGCAIKTGRVELWMIPYFIIRIIETLLGIAGLIAVLFMVVAGYQYLFGGLTEEKEKAKKTIMYAIGGLVVSLLAWAIVNLVQLALTS